MTLLKRIIPRLEIKGDNLVKGIHLEGLRVIGKPEFFAEKYYKDGADELIYQDVVASLYGTNTLENVIKKTAERIFIPLTVGGGIRSLNDISRMLRSGADKVSINSAALQNPNLIKRASEKFGSSTIVISIETQLVDGEYYVFTENGRNRSNKKLFQWIQEVQNLGAGEVIITFIEHEGTGKGFNLKLIKKLQNNLRIPLIIAGGAGNKQNVLELLSFNKVSGAAISSIFHYEILKINNFNSEKFSTGNTDYLVDNKKVRKFDTIKIKNLKNFLYKKNIKVNL